MRAQTRARRFQRIVIGPWTHARPTLATTKIGDVDFRPEAGFDSDEAMLRWFDYWLRGGSRAAVDTAPVRLFVMGENRWRDEQEWPLARAVSTSYYLRSGGRANTASRRRPSRADDGARASRPIATPTIRDNPVPTGASGGYSRVPMDRREVEQRTRRARLHARRRSRRTLEVTGPLAVTLWVTSDARDTDFTGTLVDVFPDGTARALGDGILRARYRDGKTSAKLLTPGEPTEITIDLGATSNLFRAGHRIRLEVSSSNFPRFDRNPNTGGVFGEDGARASRRAGDPARRAASVATDSACRSQAGRHRQRQPVRTGANGHCGRTRDRAAISERRVDGVDQHHPQTGHRASAHRRFEALDGGRGSRPARARRRRTADRGARVSRAPVDAAIDRGRHRVAVTRVARYTRADPEVGS